MKLPRREFLRWAASAAALPAIAVSAQAQGYPTRPVRLILGYPAGPGASAPARLVTLRVMGGACQGFEASLPAEQLKGIVV